MMHKIYSYKKSVNHAGVLFSHDANDKYVIWAALSHTHLPITTTMIIFSIINSI